MRLPFSRNHIVLIPSKRGKVALVRISQNQWHPSIEEQQLVRISDMMSALFPQAMDVAVDYVLSKLTTDVVRRIQRDPVAPALEKFVKNLRRRLVIRTRHATRNEVNKHMSHAAATLLLDEAASQARSRFMSSVQQIVEEELEEKVGHALSRASFRKELDQVLRDELGGDSGCNFGTDALPDGTRFVFSNRKQILIIVEQPPQVRSIRFSSVFLTSEALLEDGADELTPQWKKRVGKGVVQLAFPYTIFGILIDRETSSLVDLFVFYRNEPLSTVNDELHQCNMPNLSDDSSVCLEAFSQGEHTQPGSIARLAIDYFWESYFNYDDDMAYVEMRDGADTRFSSIWSWEKRTQKDSDFVLGVKWRTPDESTLHKFADSVVVPPQTRIIPYVNQRIRERVIDRMTQKIGSMFVRESKGVPSMAHLMTEHLRKLGDVVNARLSTEVYDLLEDPQKVVSRKMRSSLRAMVKGVIDQTIRSSLKEAVKNGEIPMPAQDGELDVISLVKALGGRA